VLESVGEGTRELRTASQSDVGRARRDNQDAFGEFASAAGERLLVVADGMGGHLGGATASRICVETLGEVLHDGDGAPETRLARGLALANTRIRAAAERQADLAGMGTTDESPSLHNRKRSCGRTSSSRRSGSTSALAPSARSNSFRRG